MGPLGRLVTTPLKAATGAGPRWRGLVRMPTRATPRPPGRPRGASTWSDNGSEVLSSELRAKVFSALTEGERAELTTALMGAAGSAKASVAAAVESVSRPTLVQVPTHAHTHTHTRVLTHGRTHTHIHTHYTHMLALNDSHAASSVASAFCVCFISDPYRCH